MVVVVIEIIKVKQTNKTERRIMRGERLEKLSSEGRRRKITRDAKLEEGAQKEEV